MTRKQAKRNAQRGRATPSRNDWIFAVILVALTVIVYFPAWNGKPIWDDDAHITRADLRSISGLTALWLKPGIVRQYYPVAHTVFWIEHQIWGDTWFFYHFTNIILHVFSALLLWRILLRLKIPAAWLAAALFAVHPIQVESVAWISELKNTLSGVFFFSSVLFYLRFDESKRRQFYWPALVLFVFGLMSKSVIAMMPPALLAVFWWKRGAITWKRDVLPLLPFFVIGAASGLFTAWVERNFIGAQGEVFHLGLIERLLVAGRVFWFYPFKLVWPGKLIFIYPRWEINSATWWQYLFPIGAFLVVLVAWITRHRTRAPFAGLMFFMIMLFPASGFLNVYPFKFSFVADHFQYLAGVGLLVLIAAGLNQLGKRYWPNGYRAFLAVPILLLAVLTWQQAEAYSDPLRLYGVVLRDNPACWMAHNNLGADLLQQGQTGQAIEHFEKTLEIQPENAEAHTNLGNAFSMQGRFAEAVLEYEKTLELMPDAVPPRNNLAWLLASCPDRALRNGPKAIQLAQGLIKATAEKDPVSFRTLAAAYAETGQFENAINAARQSLKLALAEGNQAWANAVQQEIALYQQHRKPGG
ncbi:MAG TPA: tetratricopeptide repeat protein [Chthoniobacterales bacterium]